MRSKRTRRSASVAAVTLAGLGVLSVGLSTPASAATGTAVQSQVAVNSAGVSAAESIFEFLAKRVLGEAASAGSVSLFNLLTGAGTGEDPNAKDFAEIKDQLADIQGQLGNMDAQLNALTKKFNKGEYAADLRELKGSGNQVNELYMTYFMPITAANQKLIDDQAAGADSATIEADREAVAQRVEAFKNVYQQNFGVYGALADSIHDYLVPGANSVLEHRGAVMMDKGYLTATDSEALRAEYDLWADYQGIAALMASFNDHLINPDDTAAIARLTRWENKRDQEQSALPTRIGNGTIVATPNGTTKGAKVYVAPAGKAQSWLPSTMIFPDINSPVVNPQDEGLDWAGTAASEISPRDADGNLIPGGSDWSLWSDADAKELTAAVADVSGQSVGAQLDALAADTDPQNLGLAANWKNLVGSGHAWTNDAAVQPVACGYTIKSWPIDALIKSYKFPINGHRAIDLSSSGGASGLYSGAFEDFSVNSYDTRSDDATALTECKAQVKSMIAASDDQAGTVLVRFATDAENYMAESR